MITDPGGLRAGGLFEWHTVVETEGFSKVDCIKATVEQLRLPVGEAKRVVHDSAAWADDREGHDEWQSGCRARWATSAPRGDDGGECLAVGVTRNPGPRIAQHSYWTAARSDSSGRMTVAITLWWAGWAT